MEVYSIEEQEKRIELIKKNTDSLQQLIDANIGQQVLVRIVRDTHEGCTGFGGKGQIAQRTQMALGIPTQKTIPVYEEMPPLLRIPTAAYVFYNEYSSTRGKHWEKRNGTIDIDILHIANLNRELPFRSFGEEAHDLSTLSSSLEVIAGDLDVAAHFNLGHAMLPSEYQRVQKERKEGKITDEQLKQRLREIPYYPSMDYLVAVKELGAKIVPELESKLEDFKQGIVLAIYLSNVPKGNLDQALLLDMHKEPRTIELKGEGVTVNVPEFIRSQCKKYDMKIPEAL